MVNIIITYKEWRPLGTVRAATREQYELVVNQMFEKMATLQTFGVEHPYIVGSAALVGVVIVLVWRMVPKSGPNPFRKDVSRASGPLITDKAARNKVLKQGKFDVTAALTYGIIMTKAIISNNFDENITINTYNIILKITIFFNTYLKVSRRAKPRQRPKAKRK